MLFTVLAGFAAACLLLPFGRFVKARWSVLLPFVPVLLFVFYLLQAPAVMDGTVFAQRTAWMPTLGADLDFRLDGLSLLFSLLITGIGSAIFFYGRTYLKGHPYFDRFFAYLLLFMGAMLGLVLSDNLITLFVFWELTSISSFFLIGFNNDSADSRKSALTALCVTGLGGFFLLAGFVLLGNIAGTFAISELAGQREAIAGHPLYPLFVGFVLLGAQTSAQAAWQTGGQ